MREFLIRAIHLLVTLLKLGRPSGVRPSLRSRVLLKHQLLISNRLRYCAPNLNALDRVVRGRGDAVGEPIPDSAARRAYQAGNAIQLPSRW